MGVLTRFRSARSSSNVNTRHSSAGGGTFADHNIISNSSSNNNAININPRRAMSELPLPHHRGGSTIDVHGGLKNGKGGGGGGISNSRRSIGSFFGRGIGGSLISRKSQRREPAEDDLEEDTCDSAEERRNNLHNGLHVSRESSLSSGPPPTIPSRIPAGGGNFRPSTLQTKITEGSNESATLAASMSHVHVSSAKPPPARTAAFHGPPRFDWIDIEYAAATKIQSIHRRNMVMNDLEARGYTTSAIRNAKRRRKAANRSHRYKIAAHEETPAVFSCCAMGLAFGDATDPEPDDVAFREFQKTQYREKVEQRAAYEDSLREQYFKQHGMLDSLAMLEKVEGH